MIVFLHCCQDDPSSQNKEKGKLIKVTEKVSKLEKTLM